MELIRRLPFVLRMIPVIAVFLLSGCATQAPAVSEESAVSLEISVSESSEAPTTPDHSEPLVPEAQNGSIYDQLQDWPYVSVLITVDASGNASIVENSLYNEVAFQNGYLVGSVLAGDVLGSELVALDLTTGEIYKSNLQIWESNIHFFENDVIVFTGDCEIIYSDDRGKQSSFKNRTLLMDRHCNPLPAQLQFDYGQSDEYGRNEYLIADIAYRSGNDNYVAVFSRNPYYADPYGEYDNTVCELGIAVFDGTGQQLERYSLDGILHPFNTHEMKHSAKLPLLYLLDDATAMIVPQEGEESARASTYMWEPMEGYSIDPVIVNLSDHSFTRWTEEEMRSFLADSTILEGEMREISGYWNVMPRPQATSFMFVRENDVLLVFQDDGEHDLPLFALPKLRTPRRFRLELYYEFGGIHYMVFSNRVDS